MKQSVNLMAANTQVKCLLACYNGRIGVRTFATFTLILYVFKNFTYFNPALKKAVIFFLTRGTAEKDGIKTLAVCKGQQNTQ